VEVRVSNKGQAKPAVVGSLYVWRAEDVLRLW